MFRLLPKVCGDKKRASPDLVLIKLNGSVATQRSDGQHSHVIF